MGKARLQRERKGDDGQLEEEECNGRVWIWYGSRGGKIINESICMVKGGTIKQMSIQAILFHVKNLHEGCDFVK